jgi:hypothetical protein
MFESTLEGLSFQLEHPEGHEEEAFPFSHHHCQADEEDHSWFANVTGRAIQQVFPNFSYGPVMFFFGDSMSLPFFC